MKKKIHIVITAAVILIVSRFLIRIVDATVGIDDDIVILLVMLAAVNTLIGYISYRLYRRSDRQ